MPRPSALRRALLPAALACAAAVRAAAGPAPPVAFERVEAALRGGELAALALDAASGRLAVGDAGGVWVGRPGEAPRRLLRRGPVRDLLFLPPGLAPGGALLAATGRGLYRIAPDGAVVALAPGPGAAARSARRLAALADLVAVATDDGIFVSRDARRWRRLSGALPSGPTTAVALRRTPEAVECWAVIEGAPWRARLAGGEAPAVREAQRITLPFAGRAGGAVDLRLDLPGADAVIVHGDALALRPAPGAGWEMLRPQLPPGAAASRLASALGRVWLASDAGLLEAASLRARWQRAASPAGAGPVRALAGDATVLYAAAESGLLRGRARAPRPAVAAAAASLPVVAEEPPIDRVHRAALHYLELDPARLRAVRRGLGRRGWLPVVSFGLDRDTSRSRRIEIDEAFVSGDYRRLNDRDDDRSRDLDFGVSLSWDLGDLAYHPEQIDVSREAREVIELRDDVLDEITQFYYERRRVLIELAGQPEPTSAEALRLRLRADELAAGIDAWTGGWFSRHTARLAP